MDAVTLRGIERIIIVLFGGMSILLGWHLFVRNIESLQSGKFEAGGIKINLQKVGPGIFFSLFGAAILIATLGYGVYSETILHEDGTEETVQESDAKRNVEVAELSQQRPTGRTYKQITQNLILPHEDFEILTYIKAINTLKFMTIQSASPRAEDRIALNRAREKLFKFREKLVEAKFPKEVEEFKRCDEQFEDMKCRQEKSYKEIEKWLESTL